MRSTDDSKAKLGGCWRSEQGGGWIAGFKALQSLGTDQMSGSATTFPIHEL